MSIVTDPAHDLDAQLAGLTNALADLPALRAQHRDLPAWLTGWQALLTQAQAEVRAGITEGEDDARHDFLLLAEQVAQVAMLALARARVGAAPLVHLARYPLWANHLHAWHALRGARQGVSRGARQGGSWSGTRTAISGRLPILTLTALGERVRQRLTVDVLEVPDLTWAETTTELNTLAEGLLWRA